MRRHSSIALVLLCILVLSGLSILAADPVLAADEGAAFTEYCKSQFGSLDVCRKEIAIKRDDPDRCRSIETTGTRNSCFTYFAKKRNNPSFCDTVRAERNSYESVYKCLEPFIKSMENLTICDSFGRDEDTKDLCVERLYKATEDSSLCPLLSHPKKRITCYQKAAKATFDTVFCDAIKEEVDPAICKDMGIDACDSGAKVRAITDRCRSDVALAQRRQRCNEYDNELEETFIAGQKADLLFRRDDPEKETFSIDMKSIDAVIGVATLELTASKHAAPYSVRVGNVMTNGFVNLYVVNIWQEQVEAAEGQPPPPAIPKVDLCFFREPKPEERPRPEERPPEEQPPANATPTEPAAEEGVQDEQPAEEGSGDQETGEEYADEEAAEDEEPDVPQEGLLRRLIRWWWGWFGLGRA